MIDRFQEKHHDGHVYEVGDTYPADGKKLVKVRAESLTNIHKEYGVAFLEVVEKPNKETTMAVTKDPSTSKKGDT